MMLDVLYVSYNCYDYTVASFEALLAHTNWDLVERLFVNDDGSQDGSWDYLEQRLADAPVAVVKRFGARQGPVGAMNWYLAASLDDFGFTSVGTFAKIDNDFVVCPGWIDELSAVLDASPELDVLGMEPWNAAVKLDLTAADPQLVPFEGRTYLPCEHIGGKGLIRRRIFDTRTIHAEGRFGWTSFQTRHPEITKGWVAPDLPAFGLDQLPEGVGNWRALGFDYEVKGWHRMWPAYGDNPAYWDWWL